jgi:4-amino-4-deoxy-L-arabinose transferase-like glycosyltransferase
VGFLPWIFALPAALARAWRDDPTRGMALRVAIAWSAFVIAFFSASGSKLPAYILPAFPLLALAIGHAVARSPARTLAMGAALLAPIGLVGSWFAWRVPLSAREAWDWPLYVNATPWAVAAAAILVACGLAAAWLFRADRRWLGIASCTLASILLLECIENAYEGLSPRQSGKLVAAAMRQYLKPGTRLYSVGTYEQSVPFYIGRTLTLVDYEDEFALGEDAEPEKSLDGIDFEEDWLRPGDALAIMHPESYTEMKDDGLPMQVLHEDPRRVLVRKP